MKENRFNVSGRQYNLPLIVDAVTEKEVMILPYTSKILFTKEECNEIRRIVQANCFNEAEFIPGKGGKKSTKFEITAELLPEVYERIYTYLVEANRENFKFEENFLLTEPIYMNEYVAEDKGFCGWHVDGFNSDSPKYKYRKLTCVVQLTDPTEYEGGDFELFAYHGIKEDIRPQGTAYIIPSFEWHRVTEITKGTRHSLIMFLSAPDTFK